MGSQITQTIDSRISPEQLIVGIIYIAWMSSRIIHLIHCFYSCLQSGPRLAYKLARERHT